MGLLKLIQLAVALILSTTNVYTLSPITTNNKWFPSDLNTEQGLHSLLVSIDDKLRSMDNVIFSVNRLDMTFRRMSTKIDSIESQLTTLQTSMHIKTREMYEVLLKYDFQREQIIQKCETTQTRLMHKINMLESRFEESINKLQGNSEMNLGKIYNKQNDVINRVKEINSSIDTMKSYNIELEDRLNSTKKDIILHFENSQQNIAKKGHIDNLENKINILHNRLNRTEITWTQNDGPKGINLAEEQIVNDIKFELRSEAQKIGNKVSNMYNDIWKKISLLENLVKDSILQTNTTQKDLQDDLRQIFIDQRDNEGFLDIVVERILSVIQSKFNDLHRRMENNFQSLITAQSEITGTCQRIHEDESEYWSRIALILEKILDTFLNKTTNLSKQNTDLLEALKGHNSQMIRTVSDAKNMVITLAEENSHDHKNLDGSILEVAKRADIIASTVEELQDQFDEINGTILMHKTYSIQNISQINNTNLNETKLEKNINNNSTKINQTINAIEANINNGIIKIITDDLITNLDKKDTEKDLKENILIINLKNNITTNKEDVENLMYLYNATKFVGIIGTTNGTQINNDKDLNDKINIKPNTTTIEEEDSETIFILAYINFIKGHITKEEFLQEAYPGKRFKNIQEMLIFMKRLKIIRNEYLKELDKYEREENESEIIGRRRDELFDNTNFDYEDTSDEFIST